MKKLLLCYFSVTLLFLVVGHASAVTITQDSTFSVTSSGVNPVLTATKNVGITPFDPSLGTLNTVSVSINGQTHVDFGAVNPCYGLSCPPYPVDILIKNQFIGNGGKYFVFDSPAVYGWLVEVNSSFGSYDNTFSYDFIFNGVTDIAGTTIPTIINTASTYGTPPSISGHLADFAAFPVDSMTLVEISQVNTHTPIMQFDVATNGRVTIGYDYTPYPTAVPEPASMLLLGLGLASLAGVRRKFKN